MPKPVIINFKADELDSFVQDVNSCVTINNSTYSIELYPYHLSNVSASIKRVLNAKVAKFDQRLDGILLGYKNLKLITPYAALRADSCYIHVDIQGDFYIFKPIVGAKLTGIVNKTSSNHIGCLVHRVFNVSVPNKNGNESWPGFNIEIGDVVELSVLKTQLDARLPYIMASIVNKKPRNNSICNEDEDISEVNEDTPKKQKKKQKQSSNGDVVDVFNDTTKKQKKKKHSIIENNIEINENLNESTKKQKKKRNSELPIDNNNLLDDSNKNINESPKKQKKKRNSEPPIENNNLLDDSNKNINESPKKQKKKRNSEPPTENNNIDIVDETANLNDSSKKKKKHSLTENNIETNENPNESIKKQKKKRHSETTTILDESLNGSIKKKKKKNSEKIDPADIKVEELSQKTLILETQVTDEPPNLLKTPKKANKITSESQRTNESDYFVTPKNKKKQKQQTVVPEETLEKGSLEDFVPKEKKNKKRNSKHEAETIDTKTDSGKKKKNKQNEEINLEALRNSLVNEQLKSLTETKKEKKQRKSKELKPMNLSPIKPMADLEDRKNKKHNLSQSQNVDWQNKELKLYDSDLEKTLNTPSENVDMLEKSLEFNLAKIQALNADTPRKRKRKSKENDEDELIQTVNKKKAKLAEY